MTETVVRTVNVSLLFFGFVETVIIALSFRKSMLQKRSANIFVSEVILVGFCMLCFFYYYVRWYSGRDLLNIALLTIAYAGQCFIYYLYIRYLAVQVNEVSKKEKLPQWVTVIAGALCGFGVFLRVLTVTDSSFRGIEEAVKKRGGVPGMANLAGILMIILMMLILLRYIDSLGARQTMVLGFMPVFMALAEGFEPRLYGIELHYPLIMTALLIVYTQHYLTISLRLEQEELIQRQTRLDLATGRMKPHYIYNVLTSIYYLCDSNPEAAQGAVGTFADYLKKTLETMESNDVVSFSWELSTIKSYLELEKLRFGDRLGIEYDIETESFNVPPLSILALIEGAVNHGIVAKEEGGTIKLETRKLEDGGVRVNITNDGKGFDEEEIDLSKEGFEDFMSVKERLRLDLGANLNITSTPDGETSTIVTIGPNAAQKQ